MEGAAGSALAVVEEADADAMTIKDTHVSRANLAGSLLFSESHRTQVFCGLVMFALKHGGIVNATRTINIY